MTRDKSFLQELIDGYNGCCEPWKIKLAANTIAEMGVPTRYWEDLLQDLMIRVCRYQHKPVMGIKEKNALSIRIQSRIKDFTRQYVSRNRQMEELLKQKTDEEYTVDILHLCGENPHDTLSRAVRAAVARLCEPQQKICRLFMQGHSHRNVAKIMGMHWRVIRTQIASIRSQFILMGIEEIISWREQTRFHNQGNPNT